MACLQLMCLVVVLASFSLAEEDAVLVPIKFSGEGQQTPISTTWETLKVQGTPIKYEDYPFVVGVQRNYSEWSTVCGGSIIDNMHVLTSAKCLSDGGMDKYIVNTLGDKQNDALVPQKINSAKIYIHPCYKNDAVEVYNDIAIIKLDTPIQYNQMVNNVVLPPADQDLDQSATGVVISWYEALIKTDVQTVNLKECSQYYDVSSNQVCVQGRDSCIAYSKGLPFVQINAEGKKEISGIGSYTGKDCTKSPTVFTRVSKYVNWISQILKDVEPKASC